MEITYHQLAVGNAILGSFVLMWGIRRWWVLFIEDLSKGVYAKQQLGCRQCVWDGVPREEQFEVTVFSKSFAWRSMRDHYLEAHPGELWRVGRIPRGHSPSSHQ